MKAARLLSRAQAVWKPSQRSADSVVPRSGFTATLTIASAAAMAFLAVFALTLSLAASRTAESWSTELSESATVRLPASTGDDDVQTVLTILGQTPGVSAARPLSAEDQQALLAPWFGEDTPLDALTLPVLIDVQISGDGPDAEGLRQRLKAEAPGALYDDHARWRAPLVAAAGQLQTLGLVSLVLIAGVTATMIALAASSALAANAQIVEVLRLVGATDRYISTAFVRRFTLRSLGGATIGTLVALITVALLPAGADAGALGGVRLAGWHWLYPLLVPPVAAALSYGASRAAAARRLREVS